MDTREAVHQLLATTGLAALRRAVRDLPRWTAVYRGFRAASLTRAGFLRGEARFAAEPALFDSLCHVYLDSLSAPPSNRIARRLAVALQLEGLDEEQRSLCRELAALYPGVALDEEREGEPESPSADDEGDDLSMQLEALKESNLQFARLLRRTTRRAERAERQLAEAHDALRGARQDNRGLRRELKRAEQRQATPNEAPRMPAALEPLQRENERLQQENERLQREAEEQRARLSQLETDLASMRRDHRLIGAWYARQRAQEGVTSEPEADIPPLRSVLEAVQAAEGRLENVVFLAPASISAAASPYQSPQKVYEALRAIDTVFGAKWLMAELGERFGGLREEFRRMGFTYKSRESDTAKGKWPEQYGARYKGELVSIERHLALGASFDPATTLRIHFWVDEAQRKVVIAHVGRHKTNTRT